MPASALTPSDAFAQIVLPNLPAAYRLAVWLLRDHAAAEDLVQDAAERALRNISAFRGGNERSWVLRIIRNQAMTILGRARQSCELDDEMPDLSPSPEQTLLAAEGRATLEQALTLLPPALRECLILREFEELSYKDIAEVTGVPIGTVMSRLWKAREQLMRHTQGLRT